MDNDTTKLPYFKRLKKHLDTVNTHRFEVMKNCFKCGLYRQGLTHDLSKYSRPEFHVSVKYFQGNRSPYMYEKEHFGFSEGWLHHKGRNRHHWEYWYDMIDGKWVPLEMPFPFLVEMICDRVAACRVYQKEKYTKASALEYYLSRNDRFYMHENTARDLEAVLRDIAERGEEAVFADLKKKMEEYRKRKK
ncbi:MAG: catalase [Solobacterium sp.]|nr:catalase [Solobacterium sp.]